MSAKETDSTSVTPREVPSHQHFKLISEGGSNVAFSPGPGVCPPIGKPACTDVRSAINDCTTDTMKRQSQANAQNFANLPPHDQFLFSLDPGNSAELNQGIIPAAVRKEFKSKGVPLSDTARLNVMHVGKIWFITDNDQRYSVREVPTMLYVYTEER
jgi:hypothetical protein